MFLGFKRIIILSFVLYFSFCFAQGPSTSIVRDARQFRFGFEPTLTNIPMLLETTKAIVKKVVTGKGEGVLSTDMPVGEKYRTRYMERLKSECPECVVKELYDSHGELTYQIEYPDGYYIRSSTDAGALEWQTKPSTIPEIRAHTPLHQKDIFDQAKKAGIGMRFEATGGHVTFSGFGNDSFWYGNYLKFRTKNTDLDWGFFGKDAYNATPVSLWDPQQQLRYEQVHLEHDQKWENFLKKLESGLQGKATEKELIQLYQNRDLLSLEEYSAKLLEIYHNPKLENERLGKRSKPKYVANKPFQDMIENRSVRPPKDASEPLKLAEFMEAEAWYVKEKQNQNLEVSFTPNSFTPNSKKVAVRNSRKVVEDLGMDWKDYVQFSPVVNVELTGSEKSISQDFTHKVYGAGKRDQLFVKLRNRFLNKASLTSEEAVFLADLLNEMSYTIPDAIENTKNFKKKITPALWSRLSASEKKSVMRTSTKLAQKFPAANNDVLAPLQETLQSYISQSLKNDQLTESRALIPLIESKTSLLNEVTELHRMNPKTKQLGLYADLVLSDESNIEASKHYFNAIIQKQKLGVLDEVPSRFNEVAMRAHQSKDLQKLAEDASDAVTKWFSDPNHSRLKVEGNDSEMIHWLAEKRPEQRNKIFAPLRRYYEEKIIENQYGQKNFYKTTTYFDYLNEITAPEEKNVFLKSMLAHVHESFPVKNDPDGQIFREKIEKLLVQFSEPQVRVSCGGQFISQLKGMFRH